MAAAEETVTYPGARGPDRVRTVSSQGIGISVKEWGDPGDPPILLAHGGLDFARTFDLFAPRLADAGYRVVAWDQRGHGDSEHAALYSWEADVRDAAAVFDSVGPDPVRVVAHSKGAGLMLQLADAMPHRFAKMVNLDGLPTKRAMPDVPDHERTRMLAGDLAAWLDHRRRTGDAARKAGTLDELARRRGRMNPRLPHEWLRYLVSVGARRDDDGWRWKLDPSMRFGGFGPWRPEWSVMRMPGLAMPFLGILATVVEELGWPTKVEDVVPWLPPGARLVALEDTGHFVHIERTDRVAELVLEFLA